jgi:hypothetical protein
VLDPATLAAEAGEVERERAAARVAQAEVARLRGLATAGAAAATKTLEAVSGGG